MEMWPSSWHDGRRGRSHPRLYDGMPEDHRENYAPRHRNLATRKEGGHRRGLDKVGTPWLEPLEGLMNQLPEYGLAMTRAAGGSCAPADVYQDERRLCTACGVPCTVQHRDHACILRMMWRQQYNLGKSCIEDHLNWPQSSLWSRGLIPDPTRSLPPPSAQGPHT